MIAEIQREHFLANPQGDARTASVVVALVGGNGEGEPELLSTWALLKERLTGAGTRIGYRSFVAILQESEADPRIVLAKFSLEKPEHEFWRFVAAPIRTPEESLMAIREVEWRAHKAVQSQDGSSLNVIEVGGALSPCAGSDRSPAASGRTASALGCIGAVLPTRRCGDE